VLRCAARACGASKEEPIFLFLFPPLKRRATTSRPLAGTARPAPLRCATAWRRKEEDFWGALFTAINGRSSTNRAPLHCAWACGARKNLFSILYAALKVYGFMTSFT